MNLFSALIVSCRAELLTYKDLAFGVWSGREYTTRRVASQAATWYQLVPEVHVYSDEFFNGSIEAVTKESDVSNIIFHNFSHDGNHLIGSEWTHRWYYAQTRHLLTMADLYDRFPSKKWYIWADDDTYLYPDSILTFLQSANYSDYEVYGVIYCTWDSVATLMKPIRPCHPFAQGGAGVFFSHKIMSQVAPHLRNCSAMFNDPNFAGSMRLAICMERYVGVDIWTQTRAAKNTVDRLHSSNPLIETENGVKNPMSFHRMRHTLLYQIWNATESEWRDKSGKRWRANWDSITMRTFDIEIGSAAKPMLLHFGFRIRFRSDTMHYFYAVSRLEPIFDGDEDPIGYSQRFEGGIILRFDCDKRMENEEIAFNSFIGPGETAYRVKCPSISKFPSWNRTLPPIVLGRL